MRITEKAREVLFRPTSFFTDIKKEKGVKEAFQFQALVSLIGMLVPLLIILAVPSFKTAFTANYTTFMSQVFASWVVTSSAILLLSALSYGLGLLLTFVSAAIFFVWLLIWGGKQPYAKAYQLSMYSATPSTLLGWLPVVNIFMGIYGFVLLWIGTKVLYGFSTKRILMMYIVVPFLLIIAVLVLGVLLFTQPTS